MKNDDVTVIIGAGPYGLSVVAYLKPQGILTVVFGKPMELWQNMPKVLYLKSIWSASSLPDPAGKYTLDHYIANNNIKRQDQEETKHSRSTLSTVPWAYSAI